MLTKLSNSKFLIPIMAVVVISATGLGFYISLKQSQNRLEQNTATQDLFWPNPKQINDFNSKDHDNKDFGLKQMSGKWSFVFFGYTNCPDICPITMSVMADVYQKIVDEFENVQIIFITVDPERDTANKLSSYVSYFHKDFIGIHSELENENNLIKQIGIAYFYNKEDEKYLVDHSASIFVIDPKMRLIAKLSPPHQSERVIDKFKNIKRFIDEKN